MTSAGIPARERLVYGAGFLVAALLIYASHYTSHDGDSSLYAGIAQHETTEPIRRWIAPQWWALWPGSETNELFVEHPAGLFWLPAVMGRMGLPAGPSAYVVGVGASLLALLGLSRIVERTAGPFAARAVRLLVPLMPVAFVFRVRANHEYPMLLFLVASILAIEQVGESWLWLPVLCAAFAGALVVKGVFALLVVGASGLWLLLAPTRSTGRSTARAWVTLAAGLGALALTFVIYDVLYTDVTGHAFWATYWARQVGPMTFASPIEQTGLIAKHLRFYALHVLWYSAPWTLVLAWCAVTRMRSRGEHVAMPRAARMALWFALLFAAASLISLSVPSRVAERYTFSASILLGAAGIITSIVAWPRWRAWLERLDAAVPALPAWVWAALLIGRVALGPS